MMGRPSRVLALVTDAFGGIGGIARFNRNLLGALAANQDIAQVVAIPRVIPLPVETLPAKLSYRTDAAGSKLRYLTVGVEEVLCGGKFDLIICGLINLVPVSYLASRLHRAPDVCILHGIDAWSPPRSLVSRALLRTVKHFIAVSAVTKERFISWSKIKPERVSVLANTVRLEEFSPGPKDPGLASRYNLAGKRVLLTVARLVARERYKGVDEVLDVLAKLVEKHPDLVYLIVGDGTDRARLESRVKHLGLEAHVRFAGFISESEKADHYRLADVFVMPSRGEGFGIVFLEALASGLPVVGSKVDGAREALMDGRLGTLVDPSDPGDIVRGIERALESSRGFVPPELAMYAYPSFQRHCHSLFARFLQ